MLSMSKRAALAFSELAIMVLFGGLALLGYGLLTSGTERNYASSLLPSDVKTALLFSLSFIVAVSTALGFVLAII